MSQFGLRKDRSQPFNHRMWLERQTFRRQEEWKASMNNMFIARSTFGPLLTAKSIRALPYSEYKTAVGAFKAGGQKYQTWKNTHMTTTSSSSTVSLFPGPPVRPSTRGLIQSSSLPALVPPAKARASSAAPIKPRRPQQVDHSLEMYREGHGMGDGHYTMGYRFDGVVDEVGANDTHPPTMEEIEQAHDLVRDQVQMRWPTMRKAFRMVDWDKDGKVSKLEFLRVMMMLNLTQIREVTMKRLAELMDTNNDDHIDYNEWCTHLMKEDAH